MERDADVLEFYDQPTRIPLHYQARSGRKISSWLGGQMQTAGWEMLPAILKLGCYEPAKEEAGRPGDGKGIWRGWVANHPT